MLRRFDTRTFAATTPSDETGPSPQSERCFNPGVHAFREKSIRDGLRRSSVHALRFNQRRPGPPGSGCADVLRVRRRCYVCFLWNGRLLPQTVDGVCLMSEGHLPSALIGELLEVLQDAESFIGRVPEQPNASRVIDEIMRVRARLLQASPSEGVYTANLLRAILEHAVDAIIVADERGVIQLFNPAAERMFGYAADEVCGRSVNLLMPPEFAAEHDRQMTRYLETRQPHVIGIGRDVTGLRKDGATFDVHLALSEVRVGTQSLFAAFLRAL